MKCLVILSTLVLSTLGMPQPQPQYSQYGVPSMSSMSNGNSGSQYFESSSSQGVNMDGPKVYKHISIHVPPQEEEMPMKRIIRPMEKPDKIVNIIFVKAPSHSSNQQTEIILPEQPSSRTVVYVLLKRPSGSQSDIKVRQPAPTRPPKPEVYFLKYSRNQGTQGQDSGSVGGTENSVDGPRPQYGAP